MDPRFVKRGGRLAPVESGCDRPPGNVTHRGAHDPAWPGRECAHAAAPSTHSARRATRRAAPRQPDGLQRLQQFLHRQRAELGAIGTGPAGGGGRQEHDRSATATRSSASRDARPRTGSGGAPRHAREHARRPRLDLAPAPDGSPPHRLRAAACIAVPPGCAPEAEEPSTAHTDHGPAGTRESLGEATDPARARARAALRQPPRCAAARCGPAAGAVSIRPRTRGARARPQRAGVRLDARQLQFHGARQHQRRLVAVCEGAAILAGVALARFAPASKRARRRGAPAGHARESRARGAGVHRGPPRARRGIGWPWRAERGFPSQRRAWRMAPRFTNRRGRRRTTDRAAGVVERADRPQRVHCSSIAGARGRRRGRLDRSARRTPRTQSKAEPGRPGASACVARRHDPWTLDTSREPHTALNLRRPGRSASARCE